MCVLYIRIAFSFIVFAIIIVVVFTNNMTLAWSFCR